MGDVGEEWLFGFQAQRQLTDVEFVDGRVGLVRIVVADGSEQLAALKAHERADVCS